MKCKNCGMENPDNGSFCKNCGQPIHLKKSRFSPALIVVIIILIIFLAIGAVTAYVVFLDNSPVEITQLSTKNPGDVMKNSQLSANIPNTDLSKQITDAAKSGVPIYKIGNGEGPVTVVTSGVFGDQLAPQVAAMELINYLDGRKIKGTVYVIPFASPEACQDNIKLTDGVNLNQVADQSGTASNDIVNFAKQNNVSALGDFHGTEPGKNPGVTTVMCSQYPTYASYDLANQMSLYSGDLPWTYTVAGIQYDGAVEDVCNLEGVPAVTPLVLSNHGQVDSGAVQESYSQMLALLQANGNLDYDDDYLKLANADIDGF